MDYTAHTWPIVEAPVCTCLKLHTHNNNPRTYLLINLLRDAAV